MQSSNVVDTAHGQYDFMSEFMRIYNLKNY